MNRRPLLSVCVVTYKHEKYIRQCLEGIMMQKTSFDFEVIVGEDCSPDNTRSIIREFEQKYPTVIKPLYHDKNVGGYRNAYEFCFPLLTGKYIAVCEGDDYWTDPLKLQKQVDFLEAHPDHVLCFHKVDAVDEHSNIIQEDPPAERVKYYEKNDFFRVFVPTLSMVFRKCLKDFPVEFSKVKSADVFLVGMLSKYGKGADLGFVGANYRRHPGGQYNSLADLYRYEQSIHTRKMMKHSDFFSPEEKKAIGKEITRRTKMYSKIFLRKLEFKNLFKFLSFRYNKI